MKMMIVLAMTLFGFASQAEVMNLVAVCAPGELSGELTDEDRAQILMAGDRIYMGADGKGKISNLFGLLLLDAEIQQTEEKVSVSYNMIWVHGIEGQKETPVTLTFGKFGADGSTTGELFVQDETASKNPVFCIKPL